MYPVLVMYTASFPCTDLSVAGNRAGLAGAESGTLNALFETLDQEERANNKPKTYSSRLWRMES